MKELNAETVVCIGAGPSLTLEDLNLVRRAKVPTIAINNVMFSATWATVGYACDDVWWRVYHQSIQRMFRGILCTRSENTAARYGLEYVKSRAGSGLPENGVIYHGLDGGFQAIQLALLHGAQRVVLLGYDQKNGSDGKTHYHGDHQLPLFNAHPRRYLERERAYTTLARVMASDPRKIINCTRDTAMRMFPREKLEEVLGQKSNSEAA